MRYALAAALMLASLPAGAQSDLKPETCAAIAGATARASQSVESIITTLSRKEIADLAAAMTGPRKAALERVIEAQREAQPNFADLATALDGATRQFKLCAQ